MRPYNICKRGLDILICVPALVVLLPVFAVLAVVIRLGSKGPAVFIQERAGRDGKPFSLYKFRTMKIDVEPFGPSPKSGHDPRLTRTGRLLREYSLDELPQLLNVLKAEMSIVGPRPLYVSQIAEWDERQKKRLLVKPGLTGPAQIQGRGALTREEKLELDVKYVQQAGLLTDVKIILITIYQVFSRKSIYEKKYSQVEHTRGEGKQPTNHS